MNILFTGKGTSGSWQCRGVQMGGQIGKVKANATLSDCKSADVIVAVKRINAPFFDNIKASGKPWIWDLVDFYPQPLCGSWSKDQAVSWVRKQIKAVKPSGIVWPNLRMMDDCGIGGEVIYHHSREAPVNPIREKVRIVGYDGSVKYLGRWGEILNRECSKRGWAFKTGIPLDQMDIVTAFRDGEFNGYVQSHWKSNVKLANAHGSGTPFIGLIESGYTETANGLEHFVETSRQLNDAFDHLEPQATRQKISASFIESKITTESVAQQLLEYIKTL